MTVRWFGVGVEWLEIKTSTVIPTERSDEGSQTSLYPPIGMGTTQTKKPSNAELFNVT